MRSIRQAAARRPRLVDGAFAVLLLLLQSPQHGPGVLGWVLLVAVHVPLIWRRAYPLRVFWVVLALGALAYAQAWPDGNRHPGALVVLLAAISTVALREPDRRTVWLTAATAEVAIALALLNLPWGEYFGAVLFCSALLTAAVLFGTARQTRRAYLAELEERARRLERESDQQARLAVAAERARIAREMHDIVAHNLTVMVALADGAALTATRAPDRAADTMHTVSATGRQALGEMRRLLGLLRDDAPAPAAMRDGDVRAPQPGFADIAGLIGQVRTAGLRVEMRQDGAPDEEWGPGAGLTAYRLVQEALTNTLKHAGPGTAARVTLRYEPTGMELLVTDDGGAGRPSGAKPGHGLAGMAERVASYGGSIASGPLPQGGWQLRARLAFGAGS